MSNASYSQFLYGKRPGESGYQVVAHTPDLAGRLQELEDLVRGHRLWGAQPPVAAPVATGVIPRAEDLLLVSAISSAAAVQPTYDTSNRRFVWYRYVFVPMADSAAIGGRVWQLLEWLRGLPTPAAPARREDLAPLPAPRLAPAGPAERAAEADLVRRCLGLAAGDGQPLLLTALAALNLGWRLVLDERPHPGGVTAQDLIKALLLLLPAAHRGAVGLAVGDLDERSCTWAGLTLRRAGPPPSPLPPQTLWLKLSSAQLHGEAPADLGDSYADTVRALLSDGRPLPGLLARLDTLAERHQGERHPGAVAALQLLAVEPDPQRREALWQATARKVDLSDWADLLATLDAPLRPLAWGELLGRAARGQAGAIGLLGQLARSFRPEELAPLLDHLAAHPTLARRLLLEELLPAAPLWEHPASGGALRALSAGLIADHGADLRTARSLAACLAGSPALAHPEDRFALLDAVAVAVATPEDLRALVAEELGPLLVAVPAPVALGGRAAAAARRLLPPLAASLEAALGAAGPSVEGLIDLADLVAMAPAQRACLYEAAAASWGLAYPATAPLVADLIAEHRRAAGAGPWAWRGALGAWADIAGALPERERHLLDAAEGSARWEPWQRLAEALVEGPLHQARFLDRALGGQPLRPLLRAWVRAFAADLAARRLFAASAAAGELAARGPVWLAQAMAALVGDGPTAPAGARLLQRAQEELELDTGAILAVVDALAAEDDQEHGRGWGAALAAVELRLRYGQPLDAGGDGAIRRIRAASPPLAQLAAMLQGSGEDERALARLSDALADHAGLVAGWMAAVGRAGLVRGPLLGALVSSWLRRPPADDELLRQLLAVPERSPADQVALLQLCWLPAHHESHQAPDGPLPPASWGRLAAAACEAVGRCETRGQVRRVLDDCARLGLPHADRLTVMQAAGPQRCGVELIQRHLFDQGEQGEECLVAEAMDLLLQTDPLDLVEVERLHVALTAALIHELGRPAAAGGLRLSYWRGRAARPERWLRAVRAAAEQLAGTHFNHLVERARRLWEQQLGEESQAIAEALECYWAAIRPTLPVGVGLA